MIRCLIVDDARTFRAVMREILATAPGVEIVGEAGDGREAVALVKLLRPDVVTMDVRMPNVDGLAALEEIMRAAPTPVIVVSAEAGSEGQQLSFRALKLGAIEVLAKPRAAGTPSFERQAEAIRQAVRAVAGLVLVGRRRSLALEFPAVTPVRGTPRPELEASRRGRSPSLPGTSARSVEIVAIGASTGGPAALAAILASLPRDLPVPIVVVQHISPGFEPGLARWLAASSRLQVIVADGGEPLAPGHIYLAADGRHLGVAKGRILASDEPPIEGFRPSATHLFRSVARELGARAAGFILTGMGRDGAAGLLELRAAGAYTAAQSAASSVVFGMPKAALDAGATDVELDLDEIAGEIRRLVGDPRWTPAP
jgi:two-component system chemotaxis response regulator CheB